MEITAPDGTPWSVRVVWEPRWRALARRFGGWRAKRRNDVEPGEVLTTGADASIQVGGSGGGSSGDELVIVGIALFGLVVAGVLFWWVLLPLLLIVLDGLIVAMLLVASVLARVLLRRPWIVRATAGTGETTEMSVIGWQSALRHRDAIADSLRAYGLGPATEHPIAAHTAGFDGHRPK